MCFSPWQRFLQEALRSRRGVSLGPARGTRKRGKACRLRGWRLLTFLTKIFERCAVYGKLEFNNPKTQKNRKMVVLLFKSFSGLIWNSTMQLCLSSLRREISRIAVGGIPSSSVSRRIFFSATHSFVLRSFYDFWLKFIIFLFFG